MENFVFKEIDGRVILLESLIDEENVIIPDKINGKPVIEIGRECFKNCTKIKSIYIPDCVEAIGSKAFLGCKKLAEINMPYSLKTIGIKAFEGCNNLKSIFIDSPFFIISKVFYDSLPTSLWIKMSRRNLKNDTWLDSSYEYHTVTGYDRKFDSNCHELSITKDDLYYFINEDEKVVIGHGKDPYNFIGKSIVIPSEIDGREVYAIGTEAFKDASFNSMILPKTIKVISALSFYNSNFYYLQLPNELEYLSDKVFETIYPVFDLSNHTLKFNYSRIIKMPDKITDLDKRSLDFGYSSKCVFEKEITYESFIDPINGTTHFDNNTNIIYATLNNGMNVILFAPNFKNKDIPEVVNGVTINAWDTYLVENIRMYEGVKRDENGLIDENQDIELLCGKNENVEIKIPENVKYITRLFKDTITLNNKTHLLFPSTIEVLSGINAKTPLFLPKSVKRIKDVYGTIFALDDIEIVSEDSDPIFGVFIGEFENSKYTYYKIIHESEECVYIFNAKPINGEIEIPSKIDDLKVIGCNILIKETINKLIISNELVYNKNEKEKFMINLMNSEINKINLIVFKNVEIIDSIKNFIDDFKYICNYFEFSEGLIKIEKRDGVRIIPAGLHTFYDKPDEDEKITLKLPKSLVSIGSNSLEYNHISTLIVYEKTNISKKATDPWCKIFRYKDSDIETKENTNNISDDELLKGNVSLLEKIEHYDLTKINSVIFKEALELFKNDESFKIKYLNDKNLIYAELIEPDNHTIRIALLNDF